MNHSKISKFIRKKTNTYLKISIILFTLSLILISSSIIFIQNQYIKLKNDFFYNPNIHLIEISYLRDKINPISVSNLTLKDETNIKEILNTSQTKINTFMYSDYIINFGMSDLDNNLYIVHGIDNQSLNNLNIPELPDNTAYVSTNIDLSDVTLNIPVIDKNDGGFTSFESIPFLLKLIPIDINFPPINFNNDINLNTNTIFLNTSTFKNIVEQMYQITWESFKSNYDSGNDYGLQLINKIYVYVNEIGNVKDIANLLTNNGYEVSYTLSAFDNLKNSIDSNILMFVLLVLFIFIVTLINIIITFNSYIKSMQKDMGILLHYKYSRKMLYKIYINVILKPFYIISILTLGYIVIFSKIILGNIFLNYILFNFGFIFLIVFIIVILILYILYIILNKNTLYLLKFSKEIE